MLEWFQIGKNWQARRLDFFIIAGFSVLNPIPSLHSNVYL